MSRGKPTKPQPMSLFMSTNSLRNNVFSAPKDAVTYEIRTTWWDPTITRVSRLDIENQQETLIAEVERKSDTEPRIRLNWLDDFAEFRNASQWLKVVLDAQRSANFTSLDGRTYQWILRKGSLQVVKDGECNTPIVTFHKAERHFHIYWRMSKHASLEVVQDSIKNLDAFVVSYLLVERLRRDGYMSSG